MMEYSEACRSLTVDTSYDRLIGDHDSGFNACVEICDRWTGQDRVAVRFLSADGAVETVGFDTVHRRACAFAAMLADRGIGPGDRVAGLLPRTPALLTVLLGTLRAGAVYQPLFTAFGPTAIESRLAGSAARLVVTDSANRPKLAGIDCPVLVSDGEGDEGLAAALSGQPDHVAPVPIRADDPFLMLFTSGTTGMPKGVMVPIHMLRAIDVYMRYGIDLRPDDSFWNLADPGWAYGLYYGVIGPLLLGHPVTLMEASFTAERAYDLIARFAVTNLAGAPTAFRAMAASPRAAPSGLRAISSAGEPLDPETAGWLAAHLGAVGRDHYGQTELGMVICDHNGLNHARDRGVIGYPMPGWRAAILDEAHRERAAGQPGLLAIDRRSPLFWFSGYHGQTRQPFAGDYYLTGDSAVMTGDGAFRFVGRDDDVITSSGYRIGPIEVECALMEHPAVAEAAVIGVPDPVRTEIVKAFVRLAGGHTPGEALAAEIAAFVKQRLAAHAYPRTIAFVDELPKTPSGKIQRYLLREKGTA